MQFSLIALKIAIVIFIKNFCVFEAFNRRNWIFSRQIIFLVWIVTRNDWHDWLLGLLGLVYSTGKIITVSDVHISQVFSPILLFLKSLLFLYVKLSDFCLILFFLLQFGLVLLTYDGFLEMFCKWRVLIFLLLFKLVDLLLSLSLKVRPLKFVHFDIFGYIGDDQSDHHFQGDDQVLHNDSQNQDVRPSPKASIVLLKPPLRFWLLLRLDGVQILEVANLLCNRGTSPQKDRQVDWNGEERDEADDRHPVADSTRAKSNLASSI